VSPDDDEPRVRSTTGAGRSPVAVLAAVAVMLLAGCGGASDGEKRADRARYVTAADGFCAEANRAIAQHDRYIEDFDDFTSAARPWGEVMEATAADLHAARAKLGDSADAKVKLFDAAIDPYVSAVVRFARSAEEAVPRAGRRVRRSGDALYRAAQAAGLKNCGRGGNLIAERGTHAVYVLAFRDIYFDTQFRVKRLGRAFDRAAPGPPLVAAARLITQAWRAEHRALGRLEPPRALRRLHQAKRRLDLAIVNTREVLEDDATTPAAFQSARNRLRRLSPRKDRVIERLQKAAGLDDFAVQP